MATGHGATWWAALGAERFASATTLPMYEALVLAAERASSAELSVIEKDVGRTFPERSDFRAGEPALRRVLRAYALRHTYCQGMSFVAALLLQHLPEHMAFCALTALVEEFLPAGYYTDDLHGAYMDQHIAFELFLPHKLPRLAAHLKALEFPIEAVGVRWFLCLFAADLEPRFTCRLWDVLFTHGAHMLFSLTIWMLQTSEEALLEAQDVPELFFALRSLGRTKLLWPELCALAAAFPTEADVAVARARYLREKEAEAEEAAAKEAEAQHEAGEPGAADAAAVGAAQQHTGDSQGTGADWQQLKPVPRCDGAARAGGGATAEANGSQEGEAAGSYVQPILHSHDAAHTEGGLAPWASPAPSEARGAAQRSMLARGGLAAAVAGAAVPGVTVVSAATAQADATAAALQVEREQEAVLSLVEEARELREVLGDVDNKELRLLLAPPPPREETTQELVAEERPSLLPMLGQAAMQMIPPQLVSGLANWGIKLPGVDASFTQESSPLEDG